VQLPEPPEMPTTRRALLPVLLAPESILIFSKFDRRRSAYLYRGDHRLLLLAVGKNLIWFGFIAQPPPSSNWTKGNANSFVFHEVLPLAERKANVTPKLAARLWFHL